MLEIMSNYKQIGLTWNKIEKGTSKVSRLSANNM